MKVRSCPTFTKKRTNLQGTWPCDLRPYFRSIGVRSLSITASKACV